MPSKSKAVRLGQKSYWENKLDQRMSALAEKGLDPKKIAKDATVKNIRAQMRKTQSRLKAITRLEEKTEELEKAKAEKMAAPKEAKSKKEKASEEAALMSKRQQKKKKKKESKSKEEEG